MDRDNRPFVAGAVALTVVSVVLPAFVPAGSYGARVFLYGGQALLAVGGAGCMIAWLVAQYRDGPARFVVSDGAFVVPRNRAIAYQVAWQLSIFQLLGGQTVDRWAHRGLHGLTGVLDGVFTVGMSVLLVMLSLPVVTIVVLAFRDRPVMLLTPEALVVKEPFSMRTVPWEALAPGSATREHDRRTFVLPVARPDLVVNRGVGRWTGSKVSLRFADVHPRFLADAVRLYLVRPERRAGIGTAEEYDRLAADLDVRVRV